VRLSCGLQEGLSFALSTGVLTVLLIGRSIAVQPTDLLVWSWKSLGKSLFSKSHVSMTVQVTVLIGLSTGLVAGLYDVLTYKLRFGLSTGLVAGLRYGLVDGLSIGLSFALGIGLSFWILLGLFRGVSGATIEEQRRVVPNQGIHRSALNGLVFGLISMVIVGLIAGLSFALGTGLLVGLSEGLVARQVGWLSEGLSKGLAALSHGLPTGLLPGLSTGLVVGLLYGGLASFRHYALRFLLWRTGAVPWHYVPFLDYAAERILLRKVGGGYIFIHGLLLDYFASLETIPAPKKLQAHVPPG
jgi:hypothetical protein